MEGITPTEIAKLKSTMPTDGIWIYADLLHFKETIDHKYGRPIIHMFLMDSTGIIKAIRFFKEKSEAETFRETLSPGRAYAINQFSIMKRIEGNDLPYHREPLKIDNQTFMMSPFQISITNSSTFAPKPNIGGNIRVSKSILDDAQSLQYITQEAEWKPKVENVRGIVKIADIPSQCKENDYISVVARVLKMGDVFSGRTRDGSREYKKLQLTVGDASAHCATVLVWNEDADTVKAEWKEGSVYTIEEIQVKPYGFRSATKVPQLVFSSKITRAVPNQTAVVPAFGDVCWTHISMFEKAAAPQVECFSEAVSKFEDRKADKCILGAQITGINDQSDMYYKSCTIDGCKRKVAGEHGNYQCTGHPSAQQETHGTQYNVRISFVDAFRESFELTCFEDTASKLLGGVSSKDLYHQCDGEKAKMIERAHELLENTTRTPEGEPINYIITVSKPSDPKYNPTVSSIREADDGSAPDMDNWYTPYSNKRSCSVTASPSSSLAKRIRC